MACLTDRVAQSVAQGGELNHRCLLVISVTMHGVRHRPHEERSLDRAATILFAYDDMQSQNAKECQVVRQFGVHGIKTTYTQSTRRGRSPSGRIHRKRQKSREPIKIRTGNKQCASNTLDRQKVKIMTTSANFDWLLLVCQGVNAPLANYFCLFEWPDTFVNDCTRLMAFAETCQEVVVDRDAQPTNWELHTSDHGIMIFIS
ncbi:hypothetical protein EAG_16208 [Camponotus floridanus]|uniref:Uncharacterized protein n=1 Tax=Camponotus floridanus TaxID=104421 RepID=E2AG36_CAMFO|nr:hypothetical protein EAG_16208 [Camponotus floridanus]